MVIRTLFAHELLEQEFAKFNGLDPEGMVSCSSGTAALALAYTTFKNEFRTGFVHVPDYSMAATAIAGRAAGLVVRTYDVDPCGRLPPRIPINKTDQIVTVVHNYGIDAFGGLDEHLPDHRVLIVEDLAEAHGLRPKESTEAACWSFYKNKLIAGEEGGAVWFKDNKLAKVARSLRCMGFGDTRDYVHRPGGFNYRLADSLAELVRASLKYYYVKRDRWASSMLRWRQKVNDQRPKDFQILEEAIGKYPWVMPFVVNCKIKEGPDGLSQRRQKLLSIVDELKTFCLTVRPGFYPISRQQEFRREDVRTPIIYGSCLRSNADALATSIIYVGLDDETLSMSEKILEVISWLTM